MRRFAASTALFLIVLASPAGASVGRQCRRLCRPLIRCCIGAGYRRVGCRAEFVDVCKANGFQACDPHFRCTPTTPGCTAISSALYSVCGCYLTTGAFDCN
jgi:hypothetical protein